MKKLAKVLSLALVLVMVLSLGGTAWAAEATRTVVDNTVSGTGSYTVTINKNSTDKAAHTYGAYQIFKGDLAEEFTETYDTNPPETVISRTPTGNKTLSNIQWGDSIDSDKVAVLITDLNAIDGITLAAGSDAATVAKAISDASLSTDSAEAQQVAAAFNKALTANAIQTGTVTAGATSGTITGLNVGYYLIKDTANVTEDGALTRFILEVLGDVAVTEKASVPSVQKKVKETNDSNAASTTNPKNPTDWQDAADYDIGDSVPFEITATTASTVSDYVKYHVTIQDKQSAGLTEPEKFTITVLGETFYMKKDGTFYTDNSFGTGDSSKNTATTTNGTKITVSKANTEAEQTFAIKVEFENSTSGNKINAEANNKPIVVDYESVLNSSAQIGSAGNPNEVYLKFSNNPNSDDGSDEGKTPEDKVIVFTYEIKALKVEPTSDTAIDQSAYENLTPEQQANYVKIGDKWQPVQALNGAGFTLFKKVPGNSLTDIQIEQKKSSFAEAKGKGDVVQSGSEWFIAVNNELNTGSTFEFKGTDAGVYKLVETTVPSGYNKANDIDITVTAVYDTDSADPKLKQLTVTPDSFAAVVTGTNDGTSEITTDGVITGKILNQKGNQLPETGGVGTTLFYVFGSMLVIAAAVYFVTKKRSEVE